MLTDDSGSEFEKAKEEFVKYAKPYIDSMGLGYEDLIGMGIPAEVLESMAIKPEESN